MRYIILAVIFGWNGCMLHNFGLFANAKLFLVSQNLDKDEGELMFSSCQASVKSSNLLKQFRYIFHLLLALVLLNRHKHEQKLNVGDMKEIFEIVASPACCDEAHRGSLYIVLYVFMSHEPLYQN